MKLFNSATIAGPLRVVEGGGGLRRTRFPVRYGIIEAQGRRMLVDTGYGPRIFTGPRSIALRLYAATLRPKLLPFETDAVDVVLVTHLHADHVARLRDFPGVPVLASRAALDRLANTTPRAAARHGIFTELLPDDLSRRAIAIETCPVVSSGTSLGDGYDICGDASHLAMPLPGHAPGHLGIFWRADGIPTLYATDVAWTLAALLANRTPAFARRLVFDDVGAGRETEAKVRAFAAAGGRVILCHDPAAAIA